MVSHGLPPEAQGEGILSTRIMRFLKPTKLGGFSASWLRHDGRVWWWTATTCLYFPTDFAPEPELEPFAAPLAAGGGLGSGGGVAGAVYCFSGRAMGMSVLVDTAVSTLEAIGAGGRTRRRTGGVG